MTYLRFAAGAAMAALCAMSVAASADDMKPGMMTMVTPDGKMTDMPMPSKDKIDMMLKSAQVMGEDMAIFYWGNKLYMVKNEKMPNGMMSFDYWGIHSTR